MKIPFLTHSTERYNKNTTSILVSGFTLIEMMVATTIFVMVMLMGVGSLVVSSNSAKSSRQLRTAVDNVNFAMESMTRELRTGTHYYTSALNYKMGDDNDVNDYTGGTYIAFNPQKIGNYAKRVAYFRTERLDANGSPDGTYTLERCEFNTTKICSDIVAKNVDVQKLQFTVLGSRFSPTDRIQPSVIIIMKGKVNVGEGTPFVLQTIASQRSSE